MWKVLVAVGMVVVNTSAHGQPAASNVNDCTLINDPVELRNCILRFERQQTPPPQVIESQGTPSPIDATVPNAGPTLPAARSQRTPVARVPPSNDTPTSIEQIAIPPRMNGRR